MQRTEQFSKIGIQNEMSKLSNSLFQNKQEEFKEQYKDFLHKLEIEEFLRRLSIIKSIKKKFKTDYFQ